MKTTHIAAIYLGIVAGIVLFFIWPNSQKIQSTLATKNTATVKPYHQPTVTPTTAPHVFNPPTRIRIAKIDVDAAVERVGNAPDGRMDTPKGIDNTAWYKPGFKPGMKGSAVIAAHYDTPTGTPGPFYNIGKLQPGDIIETEDIKGQILKFKVEETTTHKDADFPIQSVFARNDKPRLNLITCSGAWDKEAKNYSDRLVVYAVLE